MKAVTTNLLRPEQARILEEDVRRMHNTMKSGGDAIENRARLIRRIKDTEAQMNEFCPEPLPAHEKDENALRIQDLEREITANMPTQQQMRKNPAQTVHQNILWNRYQKRNVLEWKNRKLQQEPDSEDPDLANVEILRPYRPFEYDTTAQIPGYHVMSPQGKENFETIFPGSPTGDTALKQVERQLQEARDEIDALREEHSELPATATEPPDYQMGALVEPEVPANFDKTALIGGGPPRKKRMTDEDKRRTDEARARTRALPAGQRLEERLKEREERLSKF